MKGLLFVSGQSSLKMWYLQCQIGQELVSVHDGVWAR